MSTKEQQYRQLYGEYVGSGEYSIGDMVSTTLGDTGTVIWVYRYDQSLMYVVDIGGGQFPCEVPASDIVQAR